MKIRIDSFDLEEEYRGRMDRITGLTGFGREELSSLAIFASLHENLRISIPVRHRSGLLATDLTDKRRPEKTKSGNFTTGEEGFILFSESCQSCNPVSSYSVFSSDGFMVLRSFRAHANLKYPDATAAEILYFVCSVERFFRTAAILAAIRKRMPAGCRRYGRSNTNRLNFARASQRFNSAHFVQSDVPKGGLGL